MPGKSYRVFPLPGISLFPGMLLPLRVYEPRYQELLAQSLSDDRLIAMAMVKPSDVKNMTGDPGILTMTGVGEVIHCERLSDGTHRVILEGKNRLRVLKEQPKEGLVRMFKGKIMRDILNKENEESLYPIVETLAERVTTWIGKRLPSSVHESVFQRLDEAPTVGNRIDRMAALVIHSVPHRQALLETTHVFERASMLENLTRWAGTRGPFGHTTMN